MRDGNNQGNEQDKIQQDSRRNFLKGSVVAAGTGLAVAAVTQMEAQASTVVTTVDSENYQPGITDMTASIQGAIDAVYAEGGGDVIIPSGDYGVTSLSKVWEAEITVNIRGEGAGATILRKIGTTTTPVIDFSADALIVNYSSISDIYIIGNDKTHDGIRFTELARFNLHRVKIAACDNAFDSVGALVGNFYDCYFESSNIGYRARASTGFPVRVSNSIQFFGGGIYSNSSFGVDLGDASGVHFYGTDIEFNGTAGYLETGAVIIRDTVDDESGTGVISFTNCWLESNLGMTVEIEDANLISVTFRGTMLLASEGGNTMNCGAIKHLLLENVAAASIGDTIISGATRTTIIGGTIHTYTDNSTTTLLNTVFGDGTTELVTGILTADAAVMEDSWTTTEVHIKEQAAAGPGARKWGQIWVKNTTPQELWFTDETGLDTQIV